MEAVRKKALVVEDETKVFELLERVLAHKGYTVVHVSNGKDALEKLKKDNFDILITDHMMPEMSGLDLIAHVNSHIHPRPFTIMVTGYLKKEIEIRAKELGVYKVF